MIEELLTVKEVAKVLKCNERTVRKKIENTQIQYEVLEGQSTGKGGIQYRIPLSALDTKAQIRYLAQKKKAISAGTDDDEQSEKMTIEDCTKDERQEIAFWKQCILEWQQFRTSGGKKTELDEQFIKMWSIRYPDKDMSQSTLYRKWKDYRQHGDIGLLDQRGKHLKGVTSIHPLIWAVFEDYYLDENQRSIQYCIELTEAWAELERCDLLPFPSYHTFNRQVKNIPYSVLRYFRYGEKDFEDKAAPYITRLYEGLESNDIWVADNHTFDIITLIDGTERKHRLYITVYQDVRSRKFVGWYVTDTPNSDANLFALKKAIERYGIPRQIYTDNGREFLVRDIGGRGRRKTSKSDEHTPPTILERLGIKMTNAKVRNGRAKIVERAYKEVKETLSKLFDSYTGGHVKERPEKLKKVLKSGKVYHDSEFKEYVETFIEGRYNMHPQHGNGMNGKSPDAVYAENLITKRMATPEDLNLMLMRHTRMQTVDRKGVKLNMYGQDLYYWDEELLLKYQKQKVYIRYNPEDLREVRVYDENDCYLMTVPCDTETILEYGASKEDIKTAASKIGKLKKHVKAYKENRDIEVYEKIDALDVMLRKAKTNMESQQDPQAKIIEVVRAEEEQKAKIQRAVGADNFDGIVDLHRMIENARKNRGVKV